MATVKLKLNKDRQLNDGNYPVVFQIIHSRKKRLVYTTYRLRDQEFDSAKRCARWVDNSYHSRAAIRKANNSLLEELTKLEGIVSHFDVLGVLYTVDDIVCKYNMVGNDCNLLAYIDLCINDKFETGKIGSAVAYRKTKASLERFLDSRDIYFSQITLSFVRSYEFYLQNKGLSPNTICYYMRNFKSIYNRALVSGYCSAGENSFKSIQTRPRKTIKRAINRANLHTLASLKLESYRLNFARDLFFFSFYMRGMSFVDIAFLKKSNIVGQSIQYKRRKTGQVITVALIDQLRIIIDRYSTDSEYLFPIIRSHDILEAYTHYQSVLRSLNRNLKKIAGIAGIDVPLTTYVSRHSWATQAREQGASISLISEGLGHTSETTTRIYLKQFDQSELDRINVLVSNL